MNSKKLLIGFCIGISASLSLSLLLKKMMSFKDLELNFTSDDEDEIYDSYGEKYNQ